MSPVAQKAREEGREETIGSHFDRLDTNQDIAASQNGFLAGTEETAAVSRRAFRENDRNEDDKLDTNEFLQVSGELKKRKVSNSNFVKQTGTGTDSWIPGSGGTLSPQSIVKIWTIRKILSWPRFAT
jgi:hypothetical protein